MRLKPEESQKLAHHTADKIFADPNNTFKVERAEIVRAIEFTLKDHSEEERQLEEAAERLLREKAAEFQGIQPNKAFSMIKRQLAEEKDFILSGGGDFRFSPDKISHMAHLVADKLYDDDLMDFPDEDDGPKFIKRVFEAYFGAEDAINERVRKKILSQSNPPFEGSKDWDVLFKKYREEELRRINHA